MDQVQVLSAVCKKLNNDIESLANQTSIRESAIAKLDSNQQSYDEQLHVEQISHGLRDINQSQQDTNRSNIQRYQELKLEITTLSQRLDRIFNEQQIVLRTFETDTARALSTADSRSRAFVDELRNQIFQSKTQEDTERE
ncbi:unnamed protein product, partial [Rotaria sp. Silwood2]